MANANLLQDLHQALLLNDRVSAVDIAKQILKDAHKSFPTTILTFVKGIIEEADSEVSTQRLGPKDSIIAVYVDSLSRTNVRGWANCPADPNASIKLEVLKNNVVIGSGNANLYRADLFDHGRSHGRYGYDIAVTGLDTFKNSDNLQIQAYSSMAMTMLNGLKPDDLKVSESSLQPNTNKSDLLVQQHSLFTQAGSMFEEPRSFDIPSLHNSEVAPLIIAFYLPQFHRTSINDKIWGTGFTEWRQLARSIPRFRGHYQPRIPRDLGFYDLSSSNTLVEQTRLAKQAGISAFCYYYYAFGQNRYLHSPLDAHLKSDTDMPFLIMWANENWTKTWDGLENHIILKQEYLEKDEDWLLEDFSKYFADQRYICLSGRPLFIIYRPRLFPSPVETISRWRDKLRSTYNVNPLFFMVQGFDSLDPREVGCDGAIEFPPHKLATPHPGISVDTFSTTFNGRVVDYDDFVKTSVEEEPSPFALIKTLCPSWDNDARRPNSGFSLHNSTPFKYQNWLSELLRKSILNPVYGRPIVAINAWNEWAEAAYLEPDVYFGAAYLNATARAFAPFLEPTPTHSPSSPQKLKVSVILPCFNHAKYLPERINSILSQTYLPSEIVFLDDASTDNSLEVAEAILGACDIPYKIVANSTNSGNVFKQWFKGLDEATHDLVWIAETDDSADSCFLANILPYLDSSNVFGVVGRITIVDQDNNSLPDLDHYFRDLRYHSWHTSFVIPTAQTFSYDFSICNVVPNASGFVFRKPILTDAEKANVLEFAFCGDWLFYAYTLRGGCLAYSASARSFFRKSASSASRSKFSSSLHLDEHKKILSRLNHEYGPLSTDVISAHAYRISHFFPNEDLQDLVHTLTPSRSSHPLRVCIAAHSFMVGGGEVVPLQIANYMRSLGHHVTYLVLERDEEEAHSLRERLRRDIPVVYFSDICRDVEGFLLSYNFDLFNSHNVGVEYHFWRLKVDVPCLWFSSLHGGHETVPNLLVPEFISYVARHVDAWLYLAEKNRKILESAQLQGATFIKTFNGVDVASIQWQDRSVIRDQYNVQPHQKAVVLCSRAIPEKGWQSAIDVVMRVNSTEVKAHLFLIGTGPMHETLSPLFAEHPYIHFLGHLDLPIRVLKSFDIAIFPTTFAGETYPMFLVEALSAGLPILSTNIGEIPSILGNNDDCAGVLFDFDQESSSLVDQLSAELSDLLNDRERLSRLQSNATKRSQLFLVSTQVESFLDLANEYLARAASS